MKANPVTRAKKAAAAINQVKVTKNSFTYDRKANKDELVDMLRKCECPYPAAVAKSLVDHNLVKRDSGIYTFMTDSPIHYTVILNDLNKASKKAVDSVTNAPSQKAKKELGQKVIGTISEVNTLTPLVITAEMAINYLKSEGYKIYKPITQFEEC